MAIMFEYIVRAFEPIQCLTNMCQLEKIFFFQSRNVTHQGKKTNLSLKAKNKAPIQLPQPNAIIVHIDLYATCQM